jgi:predicted nucleic acid-binding protein
LQAATTGSLTINQIVFAEIAAYFTDGGRFNKMASGLGLVREDLPWDAAREAGLAHAAYRLAGGMRERVLADLLIGAHASTRSHVLLTRDARRYRTYFPNLDIIAPDSHP